jgi:pimeloyl-ACP methyl ester carboxylesterase
VHPATDVRRRSWRRLSAALNRLAVREPWVRYPHQNGQSVRVPETSEFTTSDGVVIRFACLGTGRPLYLCHGGPLGDRRGMAAQVAALRDRFTLVSYDYRGSGASSTAPSSTYDFEHLADDLDELRVHLGHEHVDVLAHSMGVSVALHFALRHSHSARRIALAGGTPLSASRMPWTMMRTLGLRRLLEVQARALVYLVWWSWRAPSPGRDMALIRLSETTGKSDRPFRRERLAPVHDNDNATSLQRAYLNLDVADQLDRISQRVLVLYGERDAIALAGAPKFASLPHVEFAALPRIGHEVFADASQQVLDRVSAFFDHQD